MRVACSGVWGLGSQWNGFGLNGYKFEDFGESGTWTLKSCAQDASAESTMMRARMGPTFV